ncbi:MAG: GGDEF domain-containing protein [Acidimicrobiia bacterium]|nr:GGDEF domain-containing protein [Acidimicrobiia bacterium]
MAHNAEASPVPSFRLRLEETIAEPEPMCLAMIRVGIDAASTASDVPSEKATSDIDLDEVMARVQSRLTYQLRRYDLMARVADDTFMLVVKTLADTRVLDARMYQLYGALSEPYNLDNRAVTIPLALGAAVRLPSESASSLMRRADRALTVAQDAGGKAPVLI